MCRVPFLHSVRFKHTDPKKDVTTEGKYLKEEVIIYGCKVFSYTCILLFWYRVNINTSVSWIFSRNMCHPKSLIINLDFMVILISRIMLISRGLYD